MADDIEEFLKRAAQRRQAAAGRAAAPPPAAQPPVRQRPEYTSARQERSVREIPEAVVVRQQPIPVAQAVPVLVAQPVIPTLVTQPVDVDPSMLAVDQADERMESHLQNVFDHSVGSFVSAGTTATAASLQEMTVEQIRELLQKPGGLRSALLMREILDRPVHRW